MVIGRLIEPLLPRRSVRMVVTAAVLTIAFHAAFNLDFERTLSLFVGFVLAFFGVGGADQLFLAMSSVGIALASDVPMLMVIVVAAISFFVLDPLSQRGEFFSSLSFAIKLVVVAVLAYVSAIVIGPEVVDFAMSGSING